MTTPRELQQLSEHFAVWEFACTCCGLCNVHPTLLTGLELARELLALPIHIESGCRCPDRNKEVGGAKASHHLTTPEKPGEAADITVSGYAPNALYLALVRNVPQFRGYGVDTERGYLHVDVRMTGPARWKYKNGVVIPWE